MSLKFRAIGVYTAWAEGVSSTVHKMESKDCGVAWKPAFFFFFFARKKMSGNLLLGRPNETGHGQQKRTC